MPILSKVIEESASSGVSSQQQPTYIINQSGGKTSLYQAGAAAAVYSNSDAKTTFNYAISVSGGNCEIFTRKGTYNLSGSIAATTVNNVTVFFENGTTLYLNDGVNQPIISLTSVSGWQIYGGYLNGNSAHNTSGYGVYLAGATNCTIQSMQVYNTPLGAGIYLGGASTYNVVQNNTVTSAVGMGILVQYLSPGAPSFNLIEGNLVVSCTEDGIFSDSYWGVFGIIYGNKILGNTIINAGDCGIECGNGYPTNYLVADNVVTGSYNTNILFWGGNCNSTLTGNISYSAGQANIQIGYNPAIWGVITSFVTVTGGSCNSGLSTGVLFYQTEYCSGTNIVAVLNGFAGFSVNTGSYNTFDACTAVNNGYGNKAFYYPGFYIVGSATYTSSYNTVSNSVANDNQGASRSQFYFVTFGTYQTYSQIIGNRMFTYGVQSPAATDIIQNNSGWNPLGVIALPISGTNILDVGASSTSTLVSGTTYTNWNSPKTIYITGGTVTAITRNGTTLATITVATSAIPVHLEPSDTFSITFSVAPTVVVMGE